jgi:methionyl aminopeptidase
MAIIIKSPQEIATMREAGRILAQVLKVLVEHIEPGISTKELDAICVREISKRKAKPSFKGYRGFPASLCVSINDEVVHGIPGDRKLVEGDLVSLDAGVIFHGFQSDAAITSGVGKISLEASRLLEVTNGSLNAGIASAVSGAHLGDISSAVQFHVESEGFSVVREYTGHGIGREMHEDPQIPNFGQAGQGPILKKGMTLAIEPMVNVGGWSTRVSDDRWTVLTADGSLSAHFEHTIAITDAEAEVLSVL